MAQIFERNSNALARASLVLTGLIVIGLGVMLDELQRSPWVTRQGQRPDRSGRDRYLPDDMPHRTLLRLSAITADTPAQGSDTVSPTMAMVEAPPRRNIRTGRGSGETGQAAIATFAPDHEPSFRDRPHEPGLNHSGTAQPAPHALGALTRYG